ncbi:MAG: hypothetical protein JW791_00590 [Nanoarchaeota archaeon]|nr:hypothetical protein [Nanoarchaeota archaeon]
MRFRKNKSLDADVIKTDTEILLEQQEYYNGLSSRSKDKIVELANRWLYNGETDMKTLVNYSRIRVEKLYREPEVKTLLDLSLKRGRLFADNVLNGMEMPEDIEVKYDSILHEFTIIGSDLIQ